MTNVRVLRSWRRTVAHLSSVLLVLALMASPARGPLAEGADGAAQFMRGFKDRAAMLRDPALGPQDLKREFRRLLGDDFDLEAISRFVLDRHWQSASEEQRREFRRLFEDYIVAGYAQPFTSFPAEHLLVESGRAQGDHGALVASRIAPPQGESIAVDWRLLRVGGSWKIIDVVVEGISMALVFRSEFSSVIVTDSQGDRVAGLLDVLRTKTARLEAQALAETAETQQ